MRIYDIIAKKRDGLELSRQEIDFWVQGYTQAEIPDYQISALLMAIYLKGMSKRETLDLTMSMVHSGDSMDLSYINGIKVDKHSTGGVGDKTTLVLAPLVASMGIPVAKMSGRGLGHTGGTIDKLEAIPGFKTQISPEKFIENVKSCGIAIAGQTGNLVPADKKIYALRDVTATVSNMSLIASSIMSKKIAAGADAIVLDVKAGSGAFMKDEEDALVLAREMVEIGYGLGKKVVALISNMEQPLGYAVGNSLEVIEAIQTLKGQGPEDLTELSMNLAAHMIILAQKANTYEQAKSLLSQKIASGEALEKFAALIESQGGNKDVINCYDMFPQARHQITVKALAAGYVSHIDSEKIGIASLMSGAGRITKESSIDLSAGIVMKKKIGEKIAREDPVAVLHTNKEENIDEIVDMIRAAFRISEKPVLPNKLIYGMVSSEGIQKN